MSILESYRCQAAPRSGSVARRAQLVDYDTDSRGFKYRPNKSPLARWVSSCVSHGSCPLMCRQLKTGVLATPFAVISPAVVHR